MLPALLKVPEADFAGSQSGGFGMALMAATIAASAMHWGGAFFSIALGHISDTVFHGSRWQTILMDFVSTAGLLIIYIWGLRILMLPGGVVILGALLFFAGGCIQEFRLPFNLPGDILGTRLGGTGVGIVNGWSYLGASLQESRWAP